jgi:hypothetical protein
MAGTELPERLHAHKFTSDKQPTRTRRKTTAIARAVRECLHEDPTPLIQSLIDIATNGHEKSSDRIAACRELLDRGYGRSPQHAPIEDGDPLGYDEVDEAIRGIVRQLGPAEQAA